MTVAQEHERGGIGKYLIVYIAILILAGLQFVIAYQHIDGAQMFARMFFVALLEGLKVRMKRSVWLMLALLSGALVLMAPTAAFSQSCALCYTQAASSGSRVSSGFRRGILILIAPPTFMSVGLIFVCDRRRNQTRRTDDSDDSGNNPGGKGW